MKVKLKKLAGPALFFFFTAVIYSNPVPPSYAFFSELKFQDWNTWIIEINFPYGPYIRADFDSICISSQSGSTKINLDDISDSSLIFVITLNNLTSPLYINRNGDKICITSFRLETPGIPFTDELLFGNYPGSKLPGLLPVDYSICKLRFPDEQFYIQVYTKDKSPTLGYQNDTVGTTGILTGYIFDKNNTLVKSGIFSFYNPIEFDSTGIYSTRVFSCEESGVLGILDKSGIQWKVLFTDSVQYDMYPDSIIEMTIRLRDYVVDVEENVVSEKYAIEIINYPNPFNSSTNFFINIPPGLNYEMGEIKIYNTNGEKISAIILKKDSPAVWDGIDLYGKAVASGIYYYQLSLDGNVYKSSSMILLK